MALAASNGHRFSVYTQVDHRAPLWILTILSFCYSGIFLLVRLIIKRGFWGPDDVVLGISHVSFNSESLSAIRLIELQIFALGQWVVIFRAMNLGLGKQIETVKPVHLGQAAVVCFPSYSTSSQADRVSAGVLIEDSELDSNWSEQMLRGTLCAPLVHQGKQGTLQALYDLCRHYSCLDHCSPFDC